MYRFISLRNSGDSASKLSSSLLVESQITIVSKGYILPVLDAALKELQIFQYENLL